MELKESQLEIAMKRFDVAVANLEQKYCGECIREKTCEKSGLCRTAVEKANYESLEYKSVLEETEREYDSIPQIHSDRFLFDVSRCIRIISEMNNGDTGIWGIVQQMYVRFKLVRGLKTHGFTNKEY
ncbi:hypothetical protein GOV12_06115 [Candidatus Pacearchaeota archaeon]|nr:hypothetical protein [Candidatus Pacearchaeota archaeon]